MDPKPDPPPARMFPSFGNTKIRTQHYVAGVAIPHLSLPRATGGDGPLTYRLTSVPEGLSFDASARVLSGAPANTGSHLLRYRVEDADGDVDELSFRVEVRPLTAIYWTTYRGIHSTAIDANGEVQDALTDRTTPALIVAFALDRDRQHLYFAEGATIRRTNLDGSAPETILTAVSTFEIAVDATGGKLYWIEGSVPDAATEIDYTDWDYTVRRANLDGSDVEDIIDLATVSFPTALAVDPGNGKLYWGGWDGEGYDTRGKVGRANLDGSNPEDIVEGVEGSAITGVALDLASNGLYWTEIRFDESKTKSRVRRAGLDGSVPTDIVGDTNGLIYSITVDPANRDLYWSSYGPDRAQQGIRRANLDGSAANFVIEGESTGVIAVDSDREKLYWTIQGFFGATTSDNGIRRANLDGSATEYVIEREIRFPRSGGIVQDVIGGKMYWTEQVPTSSCGYSTVVLEADMDGLNERVVTRSSNQVDHLEFDVVERKLYWYESIWEWTDIEGGGCGGSSVGGVIRRANLDGSSDQEIKKLSSGSSSNRLEIDTLGRKLYWSDKIDPASHSYGIRRSNLDGTESENIVTNPQGTIDGIAIDVVGRKLYWSEHDGVLRADLDGSDAEPVISHQTFPRVLTRLQAVDGSTGKIYYLETSPDGHAIVQANLDGSGVRVLVNVQDYQDYIEQFTLGVGAAAPMATVRMVPDGAPRPTGEIYQRILQRAPFLR